MNARTRPPSTSDMRLLGRLWPLARPHRRWLWVALVLTPVGVLGSLLQPVLLKTAIDEHIATGDLDGLAAMAMLFVAVVGIGFSASALANYSLNVLGLRALTALRRRVFTHVMAQGQRFFDTRTTGALMTRTTNDVEAVYESLAWGAVSLLSDGLLLIGIFVAMMLLDWKLTLVSLSLAPLIVLIVDLFRRRLRALSLIIRSSLSRLNGFFAERIYGVTTVQLYGVQDRSRNAFRALSHRYLDAYRRSNWWDAGLYAIMDGMAALAVGSMLWFGAAQFGDPGSVVTLGLLVAFVDYLGKIFGPIRELSGRIATIQHAVAALERIFGLLDTEDPVPGGETVLGSARGDVRFDEVSFRYREGGPLVLDGVSFTMRPGEVVALVGATGSGKTTIGKLLMKQYAGYEGSIRVDGHELREVDTADLRRHVTAVHQDVYLFDGTIRENIALWAPAIDDDRVREAARLARADRFIAALPAGYEHRVTERGQNLSGGQKQLLAIARAMARDAPIVILDEATASVDSVTEALVDEAIGALLSQRTVLVIAHRLSTITKADRILVLHHGKVVEQGTHDELMAQGGRYRLLVEVGFAI
ncbi:MAG: ABC transporter ATP-binding protein [Deltaproteobacteria bacterium]|nr:ABC transporter ATP-binding protein [Deltaproteobacteria bacterium]